MHSYTQDTSGAPIKHSAVWLGTASGSPSCGSCRRLFCTTRGSRGRSKAWSERSTQDPVRVTFPAELTHSCLLTEEIYQEDCVWLPIQNRLEKNGVLQRMLFSRVAKAGGARNGAVRQGWHIQCTRKNKTHGMWRETSPGGQWDQGRKILP